MRLIYFKRRFNYVSSILQWIYKNLNIRSIRVLTPPFNLFLLPGFIFTWIIHIKTLICSYCYYNSHSRLIKVVWHIYRSSPVIIELRTVPYVLHRLKNQCNIIWNIDVVPISFFLFWYTKFEILIYICSRLNFIQIKIKNMKKKIFYIN